MKKLLPSLLHHIQWYQLYFFKIKGNLPGSNLLLKITFVSLFVVNFEFIASAQLIKQWDKTYGGIRSVVTDEEGVGICDTGISSLRTIIRTPDGGYLLGGSSDSQQGGDKTQDSEGDCNPIENEGDLDYWVVKVDSKGNKTWDKTFAGGTKFDQLQEVVATPDGGYLLGGSLDLYAFWVVKIDGKGNKIWDKTYDGGWKLTSLVVTSDGNYLVGGYSQTDKEGDKSEPNKGGNDYWLLKIDPNGKKIWDKTLGGTSDDYLKSILVTSDGGYLVGGSSTSGNSGDKTEGTRDSPESDYPSDFWVVKIDGNGKKLWDKTFGGGEHDDLSDIIATADGGYLLGGTSASGREGDKSDFPKGITDYWVIKINANGNKIWDKTLGGKDREILNDLEATPDGGYLLGGSSSSGKGYDKSEDNRHEVGYGDNDYWFIKIDQNGSKLWDKSYGGNDSDELVAIRSTSDGGYVLAGTSSSYSGGDKSDFPKGITDYWVIKIKESNPATWNLRHGGTGNDGITAMVKTADGGYLLGGTSDSGTSGDKSQASKGNQDYWIVKTDKQGKKLWDKTIGGSGMDNLTAIIVTADGGYLLGGYSDSGISGDKSQPSRGGVDYWLVKVDGTGKKLWDKVYGGNNSDNLTTLLSTMDGGYLLGGSSASGRSGEKSEAGKGNTDFWILKIDALGKKVWDKTYGSNKNDNLAALINTSNGGYLLGGSSASGISGDKSQGLRGMQDYWVIRLNENGSKLWDKTYGGVKDLYSQTWCDPGMGNDCQVEFGSSILSGLVPTTDGGFLLAGSSNADKGGEKSEENLLWNDYEETARLRDYWVVKIDGQGNKKWDKIYGGIHQFEYNDYGTYYYTGDSELKSIIPTSNNEFILAGTSDSDIGKDKSENSRRDIETEKIDQRLYDYWVVKIDGSGQKKWDKTIGGLNNDFLAAILPVSENEYLLGGTSVSGIGGDKSESSRGNQDYWLVKVKDLTAPVSDAWNLRYGGTGNEGFTAIIKTSDGGYLSGGYTNSGVSGDKTQSSQGKNDFWIVKSDAAGKKLWDKRYGGSQEEYLNRIIQTSDGGYLLAGSSLSEISGDKTQASRGGRDYWIVKISNTGVKQWDKRFGGSGYDELKKVIQLSTGEYILAGYSNSPAGGNKSQASRGGYDYWIIKISSTGTQVWDKRYGGSSDEILSGIVLTPDNGFLLGGHSWSGKNGDKSQVSRGGSDFWVISLDKNGNKLWDKTYGGSGEDEAYSLGRSGKDYFISGQSDSPAGGDKTRGSQGGKDFWFIKFNSTGAKIWDKRFGGTLDEELRASVQTSDGGYLLAGKSFSNKSGNKSQNSQGSSDYWIVKTDKDGMYQWDKRYGGSGAEELRAVIQTSDGGLLLAGKSDSGVSGDRTQPSQGGTDFWLVKVAPETSPMVAAREATEISVPEKEVPLNLLRAYPNPFKEQVTISFTLPDTQRTILKVYDSQGREISTLFNEEAQAQHTYEISWPANKQATGMYLLQLQTPTLRQQQKLLLTK
ncbi:T9SS type A sorting domain-containing protein [Adhaeribacter radiodurans]|uniref:T9SS type A sorting domain-containing protein n=1 Tax=Adhaeribacter radiodurans TaxID=2745197 RepID=A0A7L7LDZ9_9BACT|nr:T9SS type A sorting domain-containing protein [Adhaeribacter radiodurans]QMU31030.1 T9SS type A sorting domain-containing protein [Adhaeribacter radiodurans]